MLHGMEIVVHGKTRWLGMKINARQVDQEIVSEFRSNFEERQDIREAVSRDSNPGIAAPEFRLAYRVGEVLFQR